MMIEAKLILEDGTTFMGYSFGYVGDTAGEVVFNTAMTGYPESLTDPSYAGQILVTTFPLIGNYGVPDTGLGSNGLPLFMESERIHAKALVVADYSENYSHWNAKESLATWLQREKIPGITGIDTRRLTKVLREHGVMMGRIEVRGETLEVRGKRLEVRDMTATEDYGSVNWVEQVSCKEVITYRPERNLSPQKKVVLVDCGPGDPERCEKTVANIRTFLKSDKPCMGICLGNQLLAKAAGAKTYKLKYGHRSHNQPVQRVGTTQCFITSQNHGYAVDSSTLPEDWEPLFVNMNDGSNEGIRHKSKPWMSAQFHPEACSGPVDTEFLFDEFVKMLG